MIINQRDDDDDDDDFDDGIPGPGRTVLIAAVTAAATTLVTSLVSWGIDEVRARWGTPKEPPPSDKEEGT